MESRQDLQVIPRCGDPRDCFSVRRSVGCRTRGQRRLLRLVCAHLAASIGPSVCGSSGRTEQLLQPGMFSWAKTLFEELTPGQTPSGPCGSPQWVYFVLVSRLREAGSTTLKRKAGEAFQHSWISEYGDSPGFEGILWCFQCHVSAPG